MAEYIVRAGHNKAGEICRYEETFGTIEEALKAADEVSDNPWYRIVVREDEYEYEISPRRIRRKGDDGLYFPCNARGTLETDI
jgi:hypothetical protein